MLLVVVALLQITLWHFFALSPWLGGGFGMFASTDGWGRREVRAVAVRQGMRRTLLPLRDAPSASRRAAALPIAPHLQALAEQLAALPSRDEAPLRSIDVEVWGVHFERETLTPRRALLRDFSLRVDER